MSLPSLIQVSLSTSNYREYSVASSDLNIINSILFVWLEFKFEEFGLKLFRTVKISPEDEKPISEQQSDNCQHCAYSNNGSNERFLSHLLGISFLVVLAS